MLRLFYQGLWVIRLEPSQGINPVPPDISMHILHTVLYKFPKVLLRITCLTIKRFFSFFLVTLMFDSGVILWGEIRC